MSIKPRVFITAAEAKAALIGVQSLGRKGIEIHVGSERRYCAGTFSKYVTKRFLYGSPEKEPDAFIRNLLEITRCYRYDVLLPVGDVITALISKNKEQLSKQTVIPVADYSIFSKGRNKAQTMKTAMDVGVPCPYTCFPEEEDIVKIREKMEYPVMIKPAISHGARGIVRVESKKELIPKYKAVKEKFGEVIIQEFISHEGMQYKADVLVDGTGEMKAGVVYNKLRYYPINGGSSILNCTVKLDKILEYSRTILKAMSWYGFADFDYILDPKDNTIKLMEINPRFPESFRITLAAGVDFPYMLFRMAKGEKIDTCMDYKLGVYSRFLTGDILWFLTSPSRFKTKPSFFRFFGKDLHYYMLSRDDPAPFLGFLLENFDYGKLRSRLIRGL